MSRRSRRQVLDWCEHHKKDPEPLETDSDDTRKKTTEISDWDQKCESSFPAPIILVVVARRLPLALGRAHGGRASPQYSVARLKLSADARPRLPTVIQVDQEMLFEIILAANYLDIKPLLCAPNLRTRSLSLPSLPPDPILGSAAMSDARRSPI